MEEKEIVQPFFALFLEMQEVVDAPPCRTLKYPSDTDED
jgi:hypothetical protein